MTTLFAWEVGNLTFVLAGWGRLNPKWKVSNDFFFGAGAANSYNHVYRRRLLTDKFDDWVEHLRTPFWPGGGGNLNDPILKSSNARTLLGGGDVEVLS